MSEDVEGLVGKLLRGYIENFTVCYLLYLNQVFDKALTFLSKNDKISYTSYVPVLIGVPMYFGVDIFNKIILFKKRKF